MEIKSFSCAFFSVKASEKRLSVKGLFVKQGIKQKKSDKNIFKNKLKIVFEPKSVQIRSQRKVKHPYLHTYSRLKY